MPTLRVSIIRQRCQRAICQPIGTLPSLMQSSIKHRAQGLAIVYSASCWNLQERRCENPQDKTTNPSQSEVPDTHSGSLSRQLAVQVHPEGSTEQEQKETGCRAMCAWSTHSVVRPARIEAISFIKYVPSRLFLGDATQCQNPLA